MEAGKSRVQKGTLPCKKVQFLNVEKPFFYILK